MVIFFDVFIFVAFAIFHAPPPKSVISPNKPNGRMQTEWITTNMAPERVIVGGGVTAVAPDDMKIQSTNSDLPYAQWRNYKKLAPVQT
jgi:hypothetical protein